MKYLLFCLLFLFVSNSGLAQKKGKVSWYHYSSIEGKCTTRFPAEPEVEVEKKEKATTTKVSASLGTTVYFLGITVHSLDVSDPSLADVSLNSFAETLDAEITSKEEWKVGKNKGIRAILKMKEKSAICEYRVLLKGNKQYQVVVVTPTADDDEKLRKKYFKYFKIK